MKKITFAILLLFLMTSSCVSIHYQEATKNGVLILKTTPQLKPQGCNKLIVWDDAAIAFYRDDNSIPTGYCLIEFGKKAIPMYEKIRRERGLPPGSYRELEKKIKAREKRIEEYKKK